MPEIIFDLGSDDLNEKATAKAIEMTLEERVTIMEDERGVMLNLIDQQEDALKAVKIYLEGENTDSPEHRAFILGLVNGILGKGE